MTTSNQKKTALYCRLSQDDNTENESNSIQNQKMILQRYVSDHHFPNPCFYVDDGYSGASFQRPGFQQMMADMENGEIGIIITKDLSRLGRNQLHTGLYIGTLPHVRCPLHCHQRQRGSCSARRDLHKRLMGHFRSLILRETLQVPRFVRYLFPHHHQRRQRDARLFEDAELPGHMEPPAGCQGKPSAQFLGICQLRHFRIVAQRP